MLNRKNTRTIVFALLTIILFSLIMVVGVKVHKYAEAYSLCNEIQEGNEICTRFSNGSTAPLFLDKVAGILQMDGPRIPLVEACYFRNIQAVKVLLENGADPNYYLEGRMTPLEAALWNGHAGPIDENSFEIVKLLIEAGADVNLHASDDSIIVSLSSQVRHNDQIRQEIFIYLLDHGAQRELNGYEEIFHNVIRCGNAGLAYKLINEYDFDVNGVGYEGQTPLILAISYAQYNSGKSASVEMIEMLIQLGADISVRDDYGKTAYDYAVEYGYLDVAVLLT